MLTREGEKKKDYAWFQWCATLVNFGWGDNCEMRAYGRYQIKCKTNFCCIAEAAKKIERV